MEPISGLAPLRGRAEEHYVSAVMPDQAEQLFPIVQKPEEGV
jgi:hypothetical protein